MRFAVILPTLNASANLTLWGQQLKLQTVTPDSCLLIDSSSRDDTVNIAKNLGLITYTIPQALFNHGATRQLAASLIPEMDILVYLTQDAILAQPEALDRLLSAFDDSLVGAAYGRQLPRHGAGPIEAHHRNFNYPPQSELRTLADRQRLGLKTAFLSNSFAAYRRSALQQVGGFPGDVIVGEDACVAAKMLLSGWKVAYVADAMVYHSHAYSYGQEFRRYFDAGVFHTSQHWLVEQFGSATGEGWRFIRSELSVLWRTSYWLIPSALLRTALKFIGYRAGLSHNIFGKKWKRQLSMHRGYWEIAG